MGGIVFGNEAMKKNLLMSLALVAAAIFVTAMLFYNGIILFNNPSIKDYPVRGVDVSHYQGYINWSELSNQGISFAYIKATEGRAYIDERFEYNYSEAQKTSLRVGAYHFFSFESTGKSQSENYINTVTPCKNMLPPVIDLELYGDFIYTPPSKDVVLTELYDMTAELENFYGITPVIYATEETYSLYLEGEFDNCDIWIRSVYRKPRISDGRDWTFWQYTNREKLEGYSGEERFIDMNVFNGSAAEFEEYGGKNQPK